MQCHEAIDRRSLELDREIACRLAKHPEFVDRARLTLRRWLGSADPAVRPVLEEWQAILDLPLGKIQEILCGEDEKSCRLRQSSPFCGVLTRAERTRILLNYDQRST